MTCPAKSLSNLKVIKFNLPSSLLSVHHHCPSRVLLSSLTKLFLQILTICKLILNRPLSISTATSNAILLRTAQIKVSRKVIGNLSKSGKLSSVSHKDFLPDPERRKFDVANGVGDGDKDEPPHNSLWRRPPIHRRRQSFRDAN